MYFPDVVSLKQFYASGLGAAVAAQLCRRLHAMWPVAEGEALLGLGYPVPFLSSECGYRDIVLAGMPAKQGAMYWPADGKNRVALLQESALPFSDCSFNRVLLVHTLEHSDDLREVMQEIWRVLVPGGRMLAIVPNRLGIWSHAAASPFGFGRPFSVGQMKTLLAAGGLTYTRSGSALFFPPSHMRWLIKSAPAMEMAGRLLLPGLGGLLLVEAEKQIYASLRQPVQATEKTKMAPLPAIQPAFSPLPG